MSLSIIIKKILASVFYISGIVDKKINNHSTQDFIILMYHRILPVNKVTIDVQAGMYVEPKCFRRHIQFLQKHFQMASISALIPNLGERNEAKYEKPF